MAASKQYKGKDCAYCGGIGISETADHIVARGFFQIARRDNLPQVPACSACNTKKSVLEHYLVTVMPFAGQHADATETLASQVPARLARNQKLMSELANGQRYVLRAINGGPWFMQMTLPFEGAKAIALYRLIAKGLAHFHWGVNLSDEKCTTAAAYIAEEHTHRIEALLALNAQDRIVGDLGNGTFVYEGAQGIDDPRITVWRMSLYGVEVGGDRERPGTRAALAYAFSAPKHMPVAEQLAGLMND